MSATLDTPLRFKFVAALDSRLRCVACEGFLHPEHPRQLWTLTLAAGDEIVAPVCDHCAVEYGSLKS